MCSYVFCGFWLFPFKKPVVSAGEVICFPEASAQVLAIVLKKTPAKIGGK